MDLNQLKLSRWIGRINKITGLLVEATLPGAVMGELCELETESGERRLAEVVGFRDQRAILLVLGAGGGLYHGAAVHPTGRQLQIALSPDLLGRTLDSLGQPLDGLPPVVADEWRTVDNDPPEAYGRPRIDQVFETRVKAIDGLLTMGVGQRIGLFAGSGVGKSTMMGMIAKYGRADVNVISLVGERGREVQDFIEESLGPEGLKRSVVVIATSDQPPMFRLKCLYTATTIAEYFRDQGNNVLLMVDSVTRTAMAAREVGLSVGEPPTMKGYTPSVFAILPRLMERAGYSKYGSITGLYSVLVDGDDFNEPIADTARGILDGHILLSRQLAARNHFPAINVLGSISRLFTEVTTKEQQQLAGQLRDLMARYEKSEDLISIGAYTGGDERLDRAIALQDGINGFLRQPTDEPVPYEQMFNQLKTLLS